ncbi:MAG: DUF6356 family protein [Gammaproteobacteria bacterium]
MGIRRLFTEHPASVGETYLEHLCTAIGFSSRMLLGGVACFFHALLPFAFRRTGSECIQQLHDRMVMNRNTHAARADRAGAAVR